MQPFAGELSGAPPIDSPAFWKRPYRVPASADPDTATAQTILLMCDQVRESASDAGRETFADQAHMVADTARGAAAQFGSLGLRRSGTSTGVSGTEPLDAAALAGAAFWWCKTFVRFVHHEFIIRQRLGEAGHLQGLISPEVLVRMAKPEGDCAIFSECVAAFLTVFGIPYEFVTAAVNPDEPEIFSHVYLYAVLPDGSRLPVDASHGKYPGWQVPSAHVSRRQVWDASGNPVEDRGSRFDGLHNYGLRGLGTMVQDESGLWYDDGTTTSTAYVAPELPADASTYFQIPASQQGSGYIDASGAAYSGAAYQAPSQSSAQWASFATTLLKSGMTLAEINAIQPGTVVSANGAILRQNAGYSVPASGTTSLNTALGGNGLLYAGLAAVAVMVMLSMGKR